jgi:dephospho-CoA kinase
MVIGLTGKYCSGKNFVTKHLETKGFFPIDVDIIGHQVLAQKKDQIIKAFKNDSICTVSGEISRKKLGKIVFSNKKKLLVLESILHPAMISIVKDLVQKHPDAVINAALLYKMNLHLLCNAIIYVSAPLFVRIQRAKKRDNLNLWDIWKIISKQLKIGPKKNENSVDIYKVDNQNDKIAVATQIEVILQQIKKKNKRM